MSSVSKVCECCGADFQASSSSVRTCSAACRNRLIAAERKAKHIHTKACVVCQAEFQVGASDKNRQTCSDKCSYQLRGSKTSTSVALQCVTCGVGFLAALNQVRAGHGKYCSKQCMYERNKSEMTRPCERCGKPFSTPPSHAHVKTCSVECGYAMRERDEVQMVCKHCGASFLEHRSHAGRRTYCSHACRDDCPILGAKRSEDVSGTKNPNWLGGVSIDAVSNTGKAYKRQQPHIENEKSTRRQRAKGLATPAWGNLEAIREIYSACQAISKATGIVHHVDHIVPLTSDLVCGLHCEANLQVLPGLENLQKHNRTWPDMW